MTIESGKDGKSGLMIQCVSCKWWGTKPISGSEWRLCSNPELRAESVESDIKEIATSPVFACNQSEAK